jgi:hypothetical protein
MSLIAFELRVEPIGEVEFATVHVLIDGHDLVDLVRTVELPLARAEEHEEIAGANAGLEPGGLGGPSGTVRKVGLRCWGVSVGKRDAGRYESGSHLRKARSCGLISNSLTELGPMQGSVRSALIGISTRNK